MTDYVRSNLAEKELVGYKIVKVVRTKPSPDGSGLEHSLILESDGGITKQVPVGGTLTIHSFTSPNVFEAL